MKRDIELLNLYSPHSLIRQSFLDEIKLQEFNIPEAEIPKRFKINSFYPGTNLNLLKLSESISKDLELIGASERYIKRTVPGVCETVKNAYEHGNDMNGRSEIFFANSFINGKIEFLVGDEGKKINGNFVPYALLFRQKGHDKFYADIPNFYDFIGNLFAPIGHSGVGLKTMNICFDKVHFFKRENGGLLVHLNKSSEDFL